MNVKTAVLLSLCVSRCFAAQPATESFNLFLRPADERTWCAYKDVAVFESDAATAQPAISVRVTYQAGTLSELRYTVVDVEGGDWSLTDTYTPSAAGLTLRREFYLADAFKAVLEARISGGKAGPWHIVSGARSDGSKLRLADVVPEFPPVEVLTDLAAQPFVRVVTELRSGTGRKLCLDRT